MAGAIGFLSDQQVVPPSADSERLAALLKLLRERRCLLVLDNSETLFEPGQRDGRYRTDMVGYGHLLQMVGEAAHQSCLLLTSREAPPELAVISGGPVRTLELRGLGPDQAQVLLAAKRLVGTSEQNRRTVRTVLHADVMLGLSAADNSDKLPAAHWTNSAAESATRHIHSRCS
jgi:hypothetical protein